jgi:hypothetical protein
MKDIISEGIPGIIKNPKPIFVVNNPTIVPMGHRVNIEKVYVGDDDIHHTEFRLDGWYIKRFNPYFIVFSDCKPNARRGDSNRVIITTGDFTNPNYKITIYDMDTPDKGFPFTIKEPGTMLAFNNEIVINADYVIDMTTDAGQSIRMICHIMDTEHDSLECNGIVLNNDGDLSHIGPITAWCSSDVSKIFLSIDNEVINLSPNEYFCDMTCYQLKRPVVPLAGYFDGDTMDVCFLDKED